MFVITSACEGTKRFSITVSHRSGPKIKRLSFRVAHNTGTGAIIRVGHSYGGSLVRKCQARLTTCVGTRRTADNVFVIVIRSSSVSCVGTRLGRIGGSVVSGKRCVPGIVFVGKGRRPSTDTPDCGGPALWVW